MTSSIPLISTRSGDGLDGKGGAGLQAVLLDMDGTLVDTEGYWWAAEVEVFAELGHVLDDAHREIVVGGPMSRALGHLISVTGAEATPHELSTAVNRRFAQLIAGGKVPLMPGARRLLTELAAHRVATALVSASHRPIIDAVLRSLGPQHFAISVAGDEVARTKPHPDPYLLAAARLGVDPARCVALEDTATGVTSAERAGCRVVAVPSLVPIERAAGRTVLASLEQVDMSFLRSLIADAT
jgi:HAD superfamily hydrolase (TIGR01509 family)